MATEEPKKRFEVVYVNSTENDYKDKVLESEEAGSSLFLYLAAFSASLLTFACASGLSWCSPVFAMLDSNDTAINPLGSPITHTEKSHIASLYCLGGAVGTLFCGKLANMLGRKRLLLLMAVPKFICLIVLAFATDIKTFYATRFIMGATIGTAFSVIPMYLAEISEPHNRGKVTCIMTVFLTSGILYSLALGPLLSYTVFTAACTFPLMLFIVIFGLFIPESPIYLISKGKQREAEHSLMKLRGKSKLHVQNELRNIEDSFAHDSSKVGGIGVLFSDRGLRKAFVICIGLLTAQQLSGITALVAFMHQIFEASHTSISHYYSSIAVGVIQVIATIVATLLVENLGRKFLLIVSSFGCCSSISFLGYYFYSQDHGIRSISDLYWLPIACLIIFVVSFNIGLSGLPFTVAHEIFPHHVHPTATTIGTFLNFLAAYSTALAFPIIVNVYGMSHGFYLFGMILAITTIFVFVIVPETKGKTIDEIQEMLKKD